MAIQDELEDRARLAHAHDATVAVNQFLLSDVLKQSDPFTSQGGGVSTADALEASLDRIDSRFSDHPDIGGAIKLVIDASCCPESAAVRITTVC